MTITQEQLEEWKKLAEKATPGPWYITGDPWFRDCSGVLAGNPDPHVAPMIADCEQLAGEREEWRNDHPGIACGDADDDAAFIAASRTAVPSLVSEVERLREALRFYADKRRYQGPNQRPIPDDPFATADAVYMLDVTRDGGTIARAALTQEQ
jgi:hypothetical protein